MKPKQRLEKSTAREFLQFMRYPVERLTSADRPDVHAVVTAHGTRRRLGIEVTKYHVDAALGATGGSAGARLHEFWCAVQESIRRRVLPMRPRPQVNVWVSLKTGKKPGMNEARPLAGQLVRFARENAPARGKCLFIGSFDGNRFPLLTRYLHRVRITNVGMTTWLWPCAQVSAANVGVSPKHLVTTIKGKSRLAGQYKWRRGEERWLLICASGSPTVSNAGPRPEFVDWSNDALVECCDGSPFDCIYLWDRVHDWCRPLKPVGKTVHKRGGRA